MTSLDEEYYSWKCKNEKRCFIGKYVGAKFSLTDVLMRFCEIIDLQLKKLKELKKNKWHFIQISISVSENCIEISIPFSLCNRCSIVQYEPISPIFGLLLWTQTMQQNTILLNKKLKRFFVLVFRANFSHDFMLPRCNAKIHFSI